MKDTEHYTDVLIRTSKALGRLKGEAKGAAATLEVIARSIGKPSAREFIHDELLRVAKGLRESAEYEGGDEWPDIPWEDKPEKGTCK